jgi:hypothetical protein
MTSWPSAKSDNGTHPRRVEKSCASTTKPILPEKYVVPQISNPPDQHYVGSVPDHFVRKSGLERSRFSAWRQNGKAVATTLSGFTTTTTTTKPHRAEASRTSRPHDASPSPISNRPAGRSSRTASMSSTVSSAVRCTTSWICYLPQTSSQARSRDRASSAKPAPIRPSLGACSASPGAICSSRSTLLGSSSS